MRGKRPVHSLALFTVSTYGRLALWHRLLVRLEFCRSACRAGGIAARRRAQPLARPGAAAVAALGTAAGIPAAGENHHAGRPRGAGAGSRRSAGRRGDGRGGPTPWWPRGVEPDGITILRTEADVDAARGDPCRLICWQASAADTALATHDPADRGDLAYLAANDEGEPILLNRLLTDADVVLPIGCLQRRAAAGYFGIHTPLFPDLFRPADAGPVPPPGCARRRGPAQPEVAWAKWSRWPGCWASTSPSRWCRPAGDGILARAGRPERRRPPARPRTLSSRLELAGRPPGQPGRGGHRRRRREQTWENLGRALEAAGGLVEDGGRDRRLLRPGRCARPGRADACRARRSRETALRQIRHERPADALPAAQLARALDHGNGLSAQPARSGLVEDLDMVPIGGAGRVGPAGPAAPVVHPGGQRLAGRGRRTVRRLSERSENFHA